MDTNTTAPDKAQEKTCVDERLKWLQRERDEITSHIEWLHSNRAALERIGIAPSRFWEYIDFNNPTRQQILEIIKAFPGRWQKSVNETHAGRMDYVREHEEGGLRYRIWAGELPPTCKLVEEWVDVPAQPATRMLRKVVKCPEPLPKTEPEMEVV